MSTTNPDEREGRIGLMLRPIVFTLAIAIQFGWSPGDTIPIRYDPTRPGYTRAIIVDGGAPSLFR